MRNPPYFFYGKIRAITMLSACILVMALLVGCGKKGSGTTPVEPPIPASFSSKLITINGKPEISLDYNINTTPAVKFSFSAPVDHASVAANVIFAANGGTIIPFNTTYSNGDSVVVIQPAASLNFLSKYGITVSTNLQSKIGGYLKTAAVVNFVTQIDSTDKFPRISDSALLTLAQQQTFKYFWDFGDPVSGMVRERNTSTDIVTTGGTGFGVMSIIVGINRNFITRAAGLQRINKMVSFLTDKCIRNHGVFSHWINGATGATVPFSQYDDGGDLVETSLLMQGLLCARQYFNRADADEVSLRANINVLWDGIEWSWFRQGGQNVLYWHWSANYDFQINQKITGWDEALIVYALAASSNKDSIPKIVYDNGWAANGGMKNGNTYFGIQLPLGPDLGGPLFFSHYSFLGINPHDLTDAYANYFTQNVNHSLVNYNYCVANPKNFFGYSSTTWGLTASDDNISGYSAHAPASDDGVITPSAAISSLPYTPLQSMNALKFYYYTLGDKLWGPYGFYDAFNLQDIWFANSTLAIDQGPQIVMIENYRTRLLWNLFMSCPEIKRGMKRLGFQSPAL
ncbi:MAG: glucoamylase family protein [Ginsengibacter sp.]